MRDDLINELKDLLNEMEQGADYDRVVIETTGLADPAPILFSILMDPVLVHHFCVDFVICCIDAANGALHLRENPESVRQAVAADKLVITKTDLVSAEELRALRHMLRHLNPAAAVLEGANGEIDPEAVFAPSERLHTAEEVRQIEEAYASSPVRHNETVRSMSIKFEEPLEWTAFGLWMSLLLYAHGEEMLRVKGIVDVGEKGPIVINGVQHIIHPPQHLESWNGEEKNSQIVFIMKEIRPEQILRSLETFQHMLGAYPQIEEINLTPFGKRA